MKNTGVSLIFLLIFFIIGAVMFANGMGDKDKGVDVEATINRIETSTKRVRRNGRYRTETDHDVYINYVYNNQQFNDVRYSYYDSSMSKGNTITIKVDENNPSKIYYAAQNMTMGAIFMGMSVVMGLIVVFVGKRRVSE
ncbi:MAG: DUF3592 domain-containing protein [Clostridia bacterium]|nr:DUF3592 domain-containing protein [Clostridia bacterium]